MLHLFLISQLVAVALGNPFQKYPYVFLLDVGNEEIGKFNTQQIRLSIPGGSLAVRYPAVGEGDTIGHVRVSGIDFGTDLKASIIQGGPGYKYAVFVFMGNPETRYDAVVTIQTVPNVDATPAKSELSKKGFKDFKDQNWELNTKDSIDEEDANDSSEDTSDNSITKTVYSGNKKEVMQSSSNVYKYTRKDAVSDNDFQTGIDSQSEEDFHDDEKEDDDDSDEKDDYSGEQNIKGDYSSEDSDGAQLVDVNRNQYYDIYGAFKPHWLGGVRFYPQAALIAQDSYGRRVSNEDNENDNYSVLSNNIDDFGSPVEYKK